MAIRIWGAWNSEVQRRKKEENGDQKIENIAWCHLELDFSSTSHLDLCFWTYPYEVYKAFLNISMACEATGNLLKGIRRSRRTWSKGRVWNAWQERTRQWTLFTGLALEPRSGSLFSREDLEAESGPCSLRRYTTVRVPMKEDKFSAIRVSVSEEGRWNWALMPSQILASAATLLIKVAQLSFLWSTSPRCA